ncbi:MAG: leucyl aminopeptidase [Deltaproteobacteria bacterium]|nr:leucyl aminopeptidase [Deltaproteobacteria bacterium]
MAAAARAAAEGAVVGAYRFERVKTGERVSKYPLDRVALLTREKAGADVRQQAELGQKVGESVCLARDLINTPPNELYPAALAEVAAKTCKESGLACTVLDHAAIKRKGMHLLDAVGRGSAHPPCFVHMKYRPPDKRKLKRLVFVGKGLTFDSGGLCTKPAQGMEEMKGDMGGAANVIALMAAVAALRPAAEIHGLLACAENMPGGNAYRPGDIFGSLDGKKVEIINTDAEGRLALADALAYGRELEPDLLLDNATLTGACVVALGPTVSGWFSNRPELGDSLRRAAEQAGEQIWQLPLVDDLRETLKSDWADIKHVGDRWGGSITAALFLQEFVGDVPWIHMDIAGPSLASKAYDIYPKGGTGHGVLTYLRLIDDFVHVEPAAGAGARGSGDAAS